MNLLFRHKPLSIVPTVVALIALSISVASRASNVFRSDHPEEPERYDSEYYLDMLTMNVDRIWRDAWNGSDNGFMIRFGSLNVEQWNVLESLKFSTSPTGRFRFRYRLDAHHSLDERAMERSEIEAEFRVMGRWHLSLLLGPAFWKRENDIGIVVQHRTRVDRYFRLIFRVHDFANDFAYEQGDKIEGQDNRFIVQPIETAVEMLQDIGESFRLGVEGSFTNRYRKEYTFIDYPSADRGEEAYRRGLSAWVEKKMPHGLILDLDARVSEHYFDRDDMAARNEKHRIYEILPRVWWTPSSGPRLSFSAGAWVRAERWAAGGDEPGDFRKDEIMPFVRARMSPWKNHTFELGYLADRYGSERTGPVMRTDERWENRLKFAWERRFDGGSRIRLVETVDLDREDWGDYSIHDHFFMMLYLAF